MADGTCSAPECERAAEHRGMCNVHYRRALADGRLPLLARPSLAQRFWAKVDKRADDCWLWTGYRNKENGYGSFWLDGRMQPAHRVAWTLTHGPIDEGLFLDHLCRTRACVRPDHLEPVTHAENVRRGLKGVLTTHCPQGHEYTPENTYYRPDHFGRDCRTCIRAAGRSYRLRKKAQ